MKRAMRQTARGTRGNLLRRLCLVGLATFALAACAGFAPDTADAAAQLQAVIKKSAFDAGWKGNGDNLKEAVEAAMINAGLTLGADEGQITQLDVYSTSGAIDWTLQPANFYYIRDNLPAIYTLDFDRILAEGDKIPDDALKGLTDLYMIIFPRNVKIVGASAFEGCNRLSSVMAMSEWVTTIQDSAFKNCTTLEGLSFPSVASVGVNAFAGCTGMTYFSAPSAGASGSLGSGAFDGCSKLKTLILGDNLPATSGSLFGGSNPTVKVYTYAQTAPVLNTAIYGTNASSAVYAPTPPKAVTFNPASLSFAAGDYAQKQVEARYGGEPHYFHCFWSTKNSEITLPSPYGVGTLTVQRKPGGGGSSEPITFTFIESFQIAGTLSVVFPFRVELPCTVTSDGGSNPTPDPSAPEAPSLALAARGLANMTVGQPVSGKITPSVTPAAWQIKGDVAVNPSQANGLALKWDAANGAIAVSGTPSQAGDIDISISATVSATGQAEEILTGTIKLSVAAPGGFNPAPDPSTPTPGSTGGGGGGCDAGAGAMALFLLFAGFAVKRKRG